MANEMEYLRLWQQQSQLLWSRLQTLAVLQSGVLLGWYKLSKSGDVLLSTSCLCMGIIVTLLILAIMIRDTVYMDAFRKKSKGKDETENCFPEMQKGLIPGRVYGFILVGLFIVIDFYLLAIQCILTRSDCS